MLSCNTLLTWYAVYMQIFLRANMLVHITMQVLEVFVVLLPSQLAVIASFSFQHTAQIHQRGGLHPCWVCWLLNHYFSKLGKKKNVVYFPQKVQNPQSWLRPRPHSVSPAQWAQRAGVQFCSLPVPTLWASPFPAHLMLSLDVTNWVFKLLQVAAPLQQSLALLFCSLTLGFQVRTCWISPERTKLLVASLIYAASPFDLCFFNTGTEDSPHNVSVRKGLNSLLGPSGTSNQLYIMYLLESFLS